MFRRLEPTRAAAITLTVAGTPLVAREGDSVAAALLAGGYLRHRLTPVSGAPRAPFCLMGTCYDCLVVVDGERDRQACQVRVREGMAVEFQEEPVIAAGARGDDPWGVDE